MYKLSSGIGIGIIAICLGFLLSSCGVGPQVKSITGAGAYAVEFPGITTVNYYNYISAGAGESMSDTPITVEAWIKASNAGTISGTIFARGLGSGIALYVASNVVKFGVDDTAQVVSSTTNVNSEERWYHVAGVLVTELHDHGTPTTTCTLAAMTSIHIDIYVDGVYEDCAAATSPTDIDCEKCSNSIGRDTGEAVDGMPLAFKVFKGIIDEVRLWKEARTEEQIAIWKDVEINVNNWNQANPDRTLVGYWRLNQGTGSSATDSSGYGGSGSKLICASDCATGDELTSPWDGGWVAGHPF